MNILQMSLSAGILILFVIVLRSVSIHRLPKQTFVILWGIVLIRLLLPFSIPSSFSLSTFFYKITAMKSASAGNNTNVLIPHMIGQILQENAAAVKNEPVNRISLITLLWLVGVIICFFLFFTAYIKSYKKLQEAFQIKDSSFISNWLVKNFIRRKIKVLVSDTISSPLTFGFIHPKIVFPNNINWSNQQQIEYVLFHELTHIKRYDNLWKFVSALAICVHWFNPLVWVMYILFNRDLEISCDEKVISMHGEHMKTSYALSLINLAEQKIGFSTIYNGFGKNAIQERIVSIMKFKKISAFGIALSLVLIVGTGTVFITSASTNNNGNNHPETKKFASKDTSNTTKNSNMPIEAEATYITEDTITPIELEEYYQKLFLEYKKFGITFQDDKMYFNGEPVRYFLDSYEIDENSYCGVYEYINEGAVDIHTQRKAIDNEDGSIDPGGRLVDIVAYTQEEFDKRDFTNPAELSAISSNLMNNDLDNSKGRTFAQIFEAYSEYGITYEEIQDNEGTKRNLYYNGQLVRQFADISDNGTFTFCSTNTSTIDVQVLYDKDGNCIGIEAK